jgi:hypothetical protein
MTGSWSWTWCSRAAPATSPAWRTPSRPRPSSAPASCRRASGEILENHLLNEVAGTLQELIAAAEDEVKEMNTELTSRPTSTGMRLRLVWKPAKDAPDGLDRVREKLRQTIDAWSVDDRAAVGRFLQEQIAREHADNPASGWTEQLTHALDYRSWHTFTIQRLQEGQWRPATGPASGGCYPQVPGLSICQLSRRDGIDAVLVTPWRWDGRALTRADLPEEPTLGQADTFT